MVQVLSATQTGSECLKRSYRSDTSTKREEVRILSYQVCLRRSSFFPSKSFSIVSTRFGQLSSGDYAEVDRILRETIKDPIGPEFMAPPLGQTGCCVDLGITSRPAKRGKQFTAIELLRSGTTDYILKNRFAAVASSVRRELQEVPERTEPMRAEDTIRVEADQYKCCRRS